MADMMKKMGKGGLSGMMGALGGGLGGNMGGLGGNLPADLPADLPTGNQMPDFDQLSKQLGGSSFTDPFAGGAKTGFPPKKK